MHDNLLQSQNSKIPLSAVRFLPLVKYILFAMQLVYNIHHQKNIFNLNSTLAVSQLTTAELLLTVQRNLRRQTKRYTGSYLPLGVTMTRRSKVENEVAVCNCGCNKTYSMSIMQACGVSGCQLLCSTKPCWARCSVHLNTESKKRKMKADDSSQKCASHHDNIYDQLTDHGGTPVATGQAQDKDRDGESEGEDDIEDEGKGEGEGDVEGEEEGEGEGEGDVAGEKEGAGDVEGEG